MWQRDGRLLGEYIGKDKMHFYLVPDTATAIIRVDNTLTVTNYADLNLTFSNLKAVRVTLDSRHLLLLTAAGQVELRRSSDDGLVAPLPDVQVRRNNDDSAQIVNLGISDELIVTSSAKPGEEDAMQLWGMDGRLRGLIREVEPFDRQAWSAPGGQRVVVTARLNEGGKATGRLFDGNGKLLARYVGEDVSDVTFSPDGELFITSSGKQSSYKLWDAQGTDLNDLRADTILSRPVFSPAGRYIYSLSNRSLQAWDRQGQSLGQPISGVSIYNEPVGQQYLFSQDDVFWSPLVDGSVARWQPGNLSTCPACRLIRRRRAALPG